MQEQRAFTLIELLVVVSVLAILAAIALPNFLEAQTRAKASRVLADFSALRTAAEAYHVDQNRYPRMTWGADPYFDAYTGYDRVDEPIWGTMGYWITTPTAYITKFDILDPFTRGKDIRFDAILYTYHDLRTIRYVEQFNQYDVPSREYVEQELGEYFFLSLGPDGDSGSRGAFAFFLPYDPTNGSASEGNIIRGQKRWSEANKTPTGLF
ncbi:MAG: type II secretion system protein [Candidatus Sumerlaeia bacterium]|nr:type II secretion system protein [Candidatus Sumerlaeia bacterium]